MDKLQFARKRNVKECPCGESNKSGKFVPYEGYEDCGYCHGCSKTFLPERDKSRERDFTKFDRQPMEAATQYIDKAIMIASLRCYDKNNFARWLADLFGWEKAKTLIDRFFIGTAKDGNTVFWHLDEKQRVTAAKKMPYGPSGKRDRNKHPEFPFKVADGYRHCLFGLHQLGQYSPTTAINLVESEKSAIIGYSKMPQYCWLATGGANGLTKSKAQPLKGRKVIIIPDCDPAGRSGALSALAILKDMGCRAIIKDLMPALTDGTDIADIYTKAPEVYDRGQLMTVHGYPASFDDWNKSI